MDVKSLTLRSASEARETNRNGFEELHPARFRRTKMPWTTHWFSVFTIYLWWFTHITVNPSTMFFTLFFWGYASCSLERSMTIVRVTLTTCFFYFMLDLDLNKSKRASFCGSPPTFKNNDPLHIAWDESVEEVKAPKAVLNWAKSVAGRAAVERLLMAHTKRLRGILMDIGHLVHFRGAVKAGKYMEHLTVGMLLESLPASLSLVIFIAPSWRLRSNPAIPNQR